MYRAVAWAVFFVVQRYYFHSFYATNERFGLFGGQTFNLCLTAAKVFNVLLALNRMTALAWPLQHATWWAPSKKKKIVIFCIILSLCLNWNAFYVFSQGARYVSEPMGENTSVLLLYAYAGAEPHAIWAGANSFYSAVTIGILFVSHGIAFLSALRHSRAGGGQTVDKTELKLAVATGLMALLQAGVGIYFLMLFIDPVYWMLADKYMHYIRLDVLFQADALANPLFLIALSKTVRTHMAKLWLNKILGGNQNSVFFSKTGGVRVGVAGGTGGRV